MPINNNRTGPGPLLTPGFQPTPTQSFGGPTRPQPAPPAPPVNPAQLQAQFLGLQNMSPEMQSTLGQMPTVGPMPGQSMENLNNMQLMARAYQMMNSQPGPQTDADVPPGGMGGPPGGPPGGMPPGIPGIPPGVSGRIGDMISTIGGNIPGGLGDMISRIGGGPQGPGMTGLMPHRPEEMKNAATKALQGMPPGILNFGR